MIGNGLPLSASLCSKGDAAAQDIAAPSIRWGAVASDPSERPWADHKAESSSTIDLSNVNYPRVPSRLRAWGGRLPLLWHADLDVDQRRLHEQYMRAADIAEQQSGFAARTEDGRLIGPFNAALFSPLLSEGLNDWIAKEARDSGLPERVRQVVIITVGSLWNADFVVYSHVPIARRAGLAEKVLDTIRRGLPPDDGFSEPEATAYEFTRSLVTTQGVDAQEYSRAIEAFGERGVVDLAFLIGLYLTTSTVLNVFEIPAPSIPSATAACQS